MEVILTHEHADFDATASLVALHRLVPSAVPVLPQEVNANVVDFLTLFGRELSLRRREDLRRENVTRAWFVDTQHAQHVPGMRAGTAITVIDHHVSDVDPSGSADIDLQVEPVGACATILAERMTAAGILPTPIEATLMLMGVHEDTGSLTFAGTTARDARAVAWLMANGADLEVAGRFLRHPLSSAQRALYADLLHRIEVHELAGHQIIVVATETAPDFDEEISTLATKMVDLLDPAALFLLVDVGSHVQLVARSTTDDVDAGAVAEALGGGGHRRAAAAVVRGRTLAATKTSLVDELSGSVRNAARVGDIMTRGQVRTLTPEQTIEDALAFARRHGHEGYPVVEGDEVLGVLTRRQLDRAVHHHMAREPVRRLLTGERPVIAPRESVEALQQAMMTHDVGQVPVIEDGRVVGIVTRTDVLRLWAERTSRGRGRRRIDLARELGPEAIEPLRRIAAVAAERGEHAYLVGGLPRDLVLGRRHGPDTDVVIEGDAVALTRTVAERHGGRVRAHQQFGTAKWIRDGAAIDLVTARAEYYSEPTALPQVNRGSLRSDLRRRDFAINTLAIDLQTERFGEVIDLFGGLKDLEARRIRVLHSLSFIEDPTRILRAVRFETRLGFAMGPRTEELVRDAVGLLRRVTGARVRNELLQLFGEPDPGRALERLAAFGALEAIQPGLRTRDRTARLLESAPAAWSVWRAMAPAAGLEARPRPGELLALWLVDQRGPALGAAARLRLGRRDSGLISTTAGLLGPDGILADPAARDSQVYRALFRCRPEAIVLAWHLAANPVRRRHLRRFVTEIAGRERNIDGHDLTEMGVPPGPVYQRTLDAVLDARIDGLVGSRDEELALARRLAGVETSETAGDGP